MLEEHHGVVVANGGLHEALHVGGLGGHYHLEAGGVYEPRLQRLAVLGGRTQARAVRAPHHHRQLDLAAEHVTDLGGLVAEFVHAAGDEVGEVEVHDGAHAGQGRAHAAARDAGLADGRVEDAAGELLGNPVELAENAGVGGQVLAQNENGLVARHLFVQGFGQSGGGAQDSVSHMSLQ